MLQIFYCIFWDRLLTTRPLQTLLISWDVTVKYILAFALYKSRTIPPARPVPIIRTILVVATLSFHFVQVHRDEKL